MPDRPNVPLDGISTVALLIVLSFGIERIVRAIKLLIEFTGLFDSRANTGGTEERRREQSETLVNGSLSTVLSVIALNYLNIPPVFQILGVSVPRVADFCFTVVVLVAGADQLADVLKGQASRVDEMKAKKVTVTGKVDLVPATSGTPDPGARTR